MGTGSTGTGILQLNGGTIATGSFSKGPGTALLQINSGTIIATANNTNYFNNFDVVSFGTITMNVNPGVAITATNTFSGNSLTKVGQGTFKVTGTINTTVETSFLEGTMVLGVAAVVNTSTLNIASTGTLQMTLGNNDQCSHINATDVFKANLIQLDLSSDFIYNELDNPFHFDLFDSNTTVGSLDPFSWFDFSLMTSEWIFEDVTFIDGVLSFNMYVIPEPSTWALIIGGAGTFFLLKRRRFRVSSKSD